jgi:hypothetical protein
VDNNGVDDRFGRLEAELRLISPYRFVGPSLAVTFPAANTRTEVLHLCPERPDGVIVVIAPGVIAAEPGEQWTKDLALLRCSVAGPAVVAFGVLREEPTNVVP